MMPHAAPVSHAFWVSASSQIPGDFREDQSGVNRYFIPAPLPSRERALMKEITITSTKEGIRIRFRSLLWYWRSEEHTSELQSRGHLVCRLLLEKKKDTRASNQIWKTTRTCAFRRE